MAHRPRGDAHLAAVRRAEAVRQAELETARRRLADVERRASEAAAQVDACHELEPQLEPLGDGHLVACHLAHARAHPHLRSSGTVHPA